jgi:Zn-dependent protease with chaperone function
VIYRLLLCGAAVALAAFSISACLGAARPLLQRSLGGLTGTARARLLLTVVGAPAVLGLTLVSIALMPSLGLGQDHCEAHGLHHPHLCFAHVAGSAGPWVTVLSLVLGARFVGGAVRATRAAVRGSLAARALRHARSAGDAFVVDRRGAHAFVIGLVRPRIVVTRELLEGTTAQDLEIVLAHERAHARRRDPLRRVVAMVLSSFQLPGLAGWLERELSLAHEMAADDDAARGVGGPLGVAEALVRVARRRQHPRREAPAWTGGDLARRVERLLDADAGRDLPSRRLIAALLASATAVCSLHADRVHHAIETALGLLS